MSEFYLRGEVNGVSRANRERVSGCESEGGSSPPLPKNAMYQRRSGAVAQRGEAAADNRSRLAPSHSRADFPNL